MKQSLFSRDFTLVVIGQIISLFGNAAVRFALPLYLLNQTGSPALYGTVMACAFIPSILLSPIGGIVADRVNKRNIMVILDFFTAAVILSFSLLMGSVNLVVLLTATMMLLYGIAGAYQPSVQASIPALVSQEHFMEANSIINTISSFANLAGPVLGGMLYSTYGIKTVLALCMVCFFLSAVMEIFIHIPFAKQASRGGIFKLVKGDFCESFAFICREKPQIGRVTLVVCGINLFLSAMIIVAVPYLITEVLELGTENTANTLYSFTQGALAAGGLTGGILAGVFGKKLSIHKAGSLIVGASIGVFPMGAALAVGMPAMGSYLTITGCCFVIMVVSTMFSVQMISFVQAETPGHLLGKVIAVILTIAMCAQPLGNALYGVLFELCQGFEFAVILFAGGVSLVIGIGAGKRFRELTSQSSTY
ncbi:MFS transporter [bacterium 1XD21-13]|nr:MFS transporter [bacterium 1XD21-13]